MKKNLLLSFIVLFVLNTITFAGLSDPKKESDKALVKDLKENKLSDDEINRMSKHVETDNLYGSGISAKGKNESKDNLKPPPQVYVETTQHHHHGYYYGGGGVLLLVILIIVLV
jgi:hypothetical protein